ncbi:iron chelate uptake ABC transporter family permease subunit [Bacillus massiliigorillae]|uniref:iron chelate uptake ABC transporter family permease subunit n=1 Tax=Bacillus massiliigorillae TaxID=1243664 RepID=UPI0003A34C54|nr:iron chelate uptake ABC transporter family permease subunit [Bacillus massiliigorillae]
MNDKARIGLLAIIAIALVGVFMFTDVGRFPDYVLPKRGLKIFAIVITGGCIAFSTVIFQTITNNRILTPSIIGLDSLYMLIQTALIFILGSTSQTIVNKNVNFFITIAIMILFVGLLYRLLFKREGQNLYFLLLLGLIFGTLFSSMSTFLQVLIDPNEYQSIQGKMFASFNNIQTDLLWISVISIVVVTLYALRFLKYLDVLALGRDTAINLGVNYDYVVRRLLIVVAIFISISTALVGPITFLGLLVVNVAYQVIHTYKHSYVIVGSILVSIIALVGGLLLVERVFTFSTTLSVIINFVGGVYFIYLLLKENRK